MMQDDLQIQKNPTITGKANGRQQDPLIRIQGVTKEFRLQKKQAVHALSGIDLDLCQGETLALVGESGCGKSTLARVMLHLIPASSGKIYYRDQEITSMSNREFKTIRPKMQMVFQDPYASLDPRMTVHDIIAEPLRQYHICPTKTAVTEKVAELMGKVGVSEEFIERYPHQFSGGQRQRIGIARAIALDPEILVCDEPVSALDVSVQSQILNLLKRLKAEMKLTTLFIGHDLSVIHFIADRLAVMFLGRICEVAPKEELYSHPLHPYTKFLLDAIPVADPHKRKANPMILKGEVPSPVNPPEGCYFHTRCPYAADICRKERPPMKDYGKGHLAACHCAGTGGSL